MIAIMALFFFVASIFISYKLPRWFDIHPYPWAVSLFAFPFVLLLFGAVLSIFNKPRPPGPSCAQTLLKTERQGVMVYQTMSGLYVKVDEIGRISSCGSKPYSEDPYKHTFVSGAHLIYYWGNGKFLDGEELKKERQKGSTLPWIQLYLTFRAERPKYEEEPEWWFTPAIPHQRYPIDLLPNLGLDQPDPHAGKGPILTKPTVYWAVRGSTSAYTGKPFITYCSMKSPADWDGKNFTPEATKERDPSWLVQADTYTEDTTRNTCRGGVSATNGKLGAMIDVPGAAVADIDKIYQAVSQKLTDLTVE